MARFDDFDLDVTKKTVGDNEPHPRITSVIFCTSSCKTALLGTCSFTKDK